MKKQDANLLISMDFRSGRGGISRVAHLIHQSLNFKKVLSLHGNKSDDRGNILYFNKSRILFLWTTFRWIFFYSQNVIVFDHINIARLLIFVPGFFLKKVVVFLHDEEAWGNITGLRKLALEKSTHILCNSEYTRSRFVKNNLEFESKTQVCLLGGVPSSFLNPETEKSKKFIEWLDSPRPYCLFVSRLWKIHRYKGYFELLEAFKTHYEKKDCASIRLAIIGNGDDEPALQSYIVENRLGEHIKVFTEVEDIDLREFYRKSIGLIFPSTREGFGLVFLEAMFFKKCCIGILHQPAEEIIIQGKTGVLLKDNQPSSLQPVLDDFENNPDKYYQMGQEGYLHYMNCFSNENFKIRFVEALNE